MHGECLCVTYLVTMLGLLCLVGFSFDIIFGVDVSSDGVAAGVDASDGDGVVDDIAAASFLAVAIARAFSCSGLACMPFAFARVVRTMTWQPYSMHALHIGSTTKYGPSGALRLLFVSMGDSNTLAQ